MKTIKHITMLCALSAFVANAWATDYTSTIRVDGDNQIDEPNRVLENGDTINISNVNHGIRIVNGGNVEMDNPTSGLTINLGSLSNPISNMGENSMYGIYIVGNSSINVGTGTKINVVNGERPNKAQQGVYVSNSTFTATDSLGINVDAVGGNNNIGNGISLYNKAIANIGSNALIKSKQMGIYANNSEFTATENLKIEALGHEKSTGIGANKSQVDIGKNAEITAGYRGILLTTATFVGENATIKAIDELGAGIVTTAGADVTLKNSNIYGKFAGIATGNLTGSSAGAGSTNRVTIDGGSITSDGAVFASNSLTATPVGSMNYEFNIKGGTQAYASSGIFFTTEHLMAEGDLSTTVFNVEGASTKVEGVFVDTLTSLQTTLSISDNATWSSTGASNMDNLILSDANVEFYMTSTTDRITTGNLTLEGDNTVIVGLTNDFLQEVVDLGLPQDFDVGIVKSSMDGDGNISYILATSNDSGSTWDIEDLGGGWFRIDNINIVPEPSTYAAIFGALVLAFAVYRRRK